MAVWAVRKKGENNEKLMRRFKKQTQAARIMLKVRSERFHSKKKTKRRLRAEAISRAKYRKQREKEKLYL